MIDHKRLIENAIKRMNKSTISKRNKELILKFRDDCFSKGLSANRTLKYMIYLPKIAKWLGKDFDKADMEDIKKLVAEIERTDYKDWTKYDLKVIIKRFYKWLEGEDEEYPKKVKWIRARQSHRAKLPEELLTQGDIKKMIETASSIRDKAFISVLYESGCRISELLALKIKHITFTDNIAKITVPNFCKTGLRRVPLITSIPYLANWIEHHPTKDNPDSYIWVCIGTKNHNQAVSYNTLRNLLINTSERAGVKKKVNPHSFRHSRASYLANHLKEAQMNAYFGWIQGSDMPRVYVHLSGRDLDNSILEMHGLKKPEETQEDKELRPKKCPRCEKINESTARICCRCGLPLDLETALIQENKMNELARLINTPSILEKLIERKVEKVLKIKFLNYQSKVSSCHL